MLDMQRVAELFKLIVEEHSAGAIQVASLDIFLRSTKITHEIIYECG